MIFGEKVEESELGKLIKRRHPEYNDLVAHWQFMEDCYKGGREWFKLNIFRYIKEGEGEFKDRLERAYRFNHSKEVVDLVGKYIFKPKINRNDNIAPKEIISFWKKSNRSGSEPIQKFIRKLERASSIYGRVWVVVDNLIDESGSTREYAYIVTPQHVLDLSYDDNDQLNWILISETYRDDDDPFDSTGNVSCRYRLWTKTQWFLIEEVKTASDVTLPNMVVVSGSNKNIDNSTRAQIVDYGDHDLGVVPVFPHDSNESDGVYSSPSLIGDIAYLDRACANYLSNLDAIIQDQSFSQLAMPAQGLMPGDDGYSKIEEMGTKRIFTYDGEGGSQPFYLSPDPKQAEIIITVIGKIINEIYHTVGMAGERTKQDNSIGIDNSSGVAKAYDFERVNALLSTKAAALRRAEIKMCELVLMWKGIDNYDADKLGDMIIYPETFDVRGIADEFSIASNLALIDAPLEMRKEQLRILVDKLYPTIKKDSKSKILKEIDSMKEDDLLSIGMDAPSSQDSKPVSGPKANRQGENNTDENDSQN